jgi:hypothetical protein
MTEPSPARPVPGPPRPGPAPAGHQPAGDPTAARPAEGQPPAPGDERPGADSFEDLRQRPVAEHVAVFEAEHARLQRELGTIDHL